MVQRGFWRVNSLSTSQALSRVVDVAQGVFLTAIFAFGLGFEGRLLVSCNRSRRLDFALPVIDTVLIGVIILTSHRLCKPQLKLVNRLLSDYHQRDSESSRLNPLKLEFARGSMAAEEKQGKQNQRVSSAKQDVFE